MLISPLTAFKTVVFDFRSFFYSFFFVDFIRGKFDASGKESAKKKILSLSFCLFVPPTKKLTTQPQCQSTTTTWHDVSPRVVLRCCLLQQLRPSSYSASSFKPTSANFLCTTPPELTSPATAFSSSPHIASKKHLRTRSIGPTSPSKEWGTRPSRRGGR